MPITEFQLPWIMELVAIIAWATSGAIVARVRGFDFMGVFFIAIISATGGGLLRDGLFLQRTPVMLTTPLYLIVPFIVMVIVSLFGGALEKNRWWPKLVNIIDALGTPAFALLGFQLALLSGITLVGAVFVGLINGVAGGILRDVLVGDTPQIFRPGQYSGSIVLISIALYYVLIRFVEMDSDPAAWIALLVGATTRLLVIRLNWRSQPVSDWHMEQALARLPSTMTRQYRRAWLRRRQPSQKDPL